MLNERRCVHAHVPIVVAKFCRYVPVCKGLASSGWVLYDPYAFIACETHVSGFSFTRNHVVAIVGYECIYVLKNGCLSSAFAPSPIFEVQKLSFVCVQDDVFV